jgi:RNA polymerase sigma-70 factor, ECF subfamily
LRFLAQPDRIEKMQPVALTVGQTRGGTRLSADADRADVEKVLAGDIDAFENIVLRWQGPLINLAYRFCHDRSRAEDMAQDAFLRAYRALGGWRKDAAFSTWLFALATNLYRSQIRRIPPRTMPLGEMAEPRAPLISAHDGSRERAVRDAVNTLPAKYRETVTLFYFHEKNVAQAARSLGVAEGTVKARLNRGREMLRGKLLRLLKGLDLRETR